MSPILIGCGLHRLTLSRETGCGEEESERGKEGKEEEAQE